NGNAACGGASRGSMAARSAHSRALPEGSASTSSTLLPAWTKMCASQTADVVLPVPGLRLAKARLRPVIQAACQRLRRYGRQLPDAGGRCAHWNCGLRGAGWTSLRTLDPGCRVLSRPMSRTVALGTLDMSAAKLRCRSSLADRRVHGAHVAAARSAR